MRFSVNTARQSCENVNPMATTPLLLYLRAGILLELVKVFFDFTQMNVILVNPGLMHPWMDGCGCIVRAI